MNNNISDTEFMRLYKEAKERLARVNWLIMDAREHHEKSMAKRIKKAA